MVSAQFEKPPGPHKLDLIRRFLNASGIQHQIDKGRFLERFGTLGGPVFARASNGGATFKTAVDASFSTLRAAYDKHRHVWQEEYESHVNWEFTEADLEQIVAFLEAPVGEHFLKGRWRMDAYIRTNTEDLVGQIVEEAEASVAQMTFDKNDG